MTNYAAASSPMKIEKKAKQQWVPQGDMEKLDLQLK